MIAALGALVSVALVLVFPVAGTAAAAIVAGTVGAFARKRRSRNLWLIAGIAAAAFVAGLVICLFFLAGPRAPIEARVGILAPANP